MRATASTWACLSSSPVDRPIGVHRSAKTERRASCSVSSLSILDIASLLQEVVVLLNPSDPVNAGWYYETGVLLVLYRRRATCTKIQSPVTIVQFDLNFARRGRDVSVPRSFSLGQDCTARPL